MSLGPGAASISEKKKEIKIKRQEKEKSTEICENRNCMSKVMGKSELKAGCGPCHPDPPKMYPQQSPSLLPPVTPREERGMSGPRVLAPVGSWLPLTCHLAQSSGFSPSAGASCVPPPPHPLPSHPFSFHACWLRAPPSSAPSAANLSLCPVFATFPLPRPPVRGQLL